MTSQTAFADTITGTDPHPHRRIWRIAGPAIIANISGPMVGVVDTWALGHLDAPRFLAAIAVGAFIFHFIYWSFGFLRMGTTGLVAQTHGAGDPGRLLQVMVRSFALGVLFSGIILLLQEPIFAGLFLLLNPDPAVSDLAMTYCLIRIWGAPAILIRMTIIGFLIGTQRTRQALIIELALNLGNAALTVFLVTYLGWGMKGAAFASLGAEVVASLLALLIALRYLPHKALMKTARESGFWYPRAFIALLSVNGTIFIRTLFLLFAFALLWRTSAALGTDILSANQVLMQFLLLTSFGLDGIAYAAEALVGEAKGAQSRIRLSQMVRATHGWALLLAVCYSLIFLGAGRAIIHGFTDLDTIRAIAITYLPWLIVAPVIAVWSYQYDGIFIGATETRDMMWTMIAAFTLYGVTLYYLVPRFGNHGLWAAMMVFLAARGAGLALCYPSLLRGVKPESDISGSGKANDKE